MPELSAPNGARIRLLLRALPLAVVVLCWQLGLALIDRDTQREALRGLAEQLETALPVLEGSPAGALVGSRLLLPRIRQLLPERSQAVSARTERLAAALGEPQLHSKLLATLGDVRQDAQAGIRVFESQRGQLELGVLACFALLGAMGFFLLRPAPASSTGAPKADSGKLKADPAR